MQMSMSSPAPSLLAGGTQLSEPFGEWLAVPNGVNKIFLEAGDGISITAPNANTVRLDVTGLVNLSAAAGAGLAFTTGAYHVGAGNGIEVSADAVGLQTPGTLSASSTNAPAGAHTHAVSASSNPGAAAQLLKSDSAGKLTLEGATINGALNLGGNLIGPANFTLSASTLLTLSSPGIRLNTSSIEPTTSYGTSLGSPTKKFLSLHVGEINLDTLVATDVMSTIGGRILVGPTTNLIEDITAGATSIKVKHNNLLSGDRIYMEADGNVEFMAVTSIASTVTGGYQYSVTRNLDGTGANAWAAGDAVFNTGTTGNGFIDVYSTRGVRAATEVGPTIAFNKRTGTSYNEWETRAAAGNLRGLYSYVADTYGFAAGAPTGAWFGADETNGVRLMHGSTPKLTLAPSGTATFTGDIVGAGGVVNINTNGLSIASAASYLDTRALVFRRPNGNVQGGLYGRYSGLEDNDTQVQVFARGLSTSVGSSGSGRVDVIAEGSIDAPYGNANVYITARRGDGGTTSVLNLNSNGDAYFSTQLGIGMNVTGGAGATLTDANIKGLYMEDFDSSGSYNNKGIVFKSGTANHAFIAHQKVSAGATDLVLGVHNGEAARLRKVGGVFMLGIGRQGGSYALEVQGEAGKTGGTSAWIVISDERTKQARVKRGGALARIAQLPDLEEWEYNGKAGTQPGHKAVGFTAQGLRALYPEAVITSNEQLDGEPVLHVNYHALYMDMAQALKELAREVATLRQGGGNVADKRA